MVFIVFSGTPQTSALIKLEMLVKKGVHMTYTYRIKIAAVAIIGLIISTATTYANGAQLLIISENGQPIIGADVLVGPSIGTPFTNNHFQTDLNGQVSIPAEWVAKLPVTISASGHLTATYLNVAPVSETFQVHLEDAKIAYEVKGQTTNYRDLRKDGKVDFSLVYPALRENQLIQFDVGNVINPDVDILSIVTEKVPVPSNLSIPKQKENYIVPITLDKPIYRMSFKQTGNYRMTALHGQFPLKQVVGDIRDGKEFYDVINYFRILGGGQRDVAVNGAIEGQDIPIDQMTFDKKIIARGPQIKPEHIMFSLALAQSGGLYYTTDIKKINTGDNTELTTSSQVESSSTISILMNKEDVSLTATSFFKDASPANDSQSPINPYKSLSKISTELLSIFKLADDEASEPIKQDLNEGPGGVSTVHQIANQTESSAPAFLNLVPRPVLAPNALTLTPPNLIPEIEPVATYILLSEIERRVVNKYTIENKIRVWEVTQLGWSKDINLPQMPQNLTPGKNYRWEVLFLGRQTGHNKKSSGEYFLDGITHVSRNSFDF